MNKEIVELFTKYYHNFCSQEELDKVMAILREGKYPDELESMLKQEAIQVMERSHEAEMSVREMISLNQRILYALNDKKYKTIKLFSRKSWSQVGMAAAIIFVLGIGAYFYNINYLSDKNPVEFVNTIDIAPARQGATLTLANGKKIYLSDAVNGELAEETGVGITKTADGQIVYESKHLNAASTKINTLSTEKGETYQLCLPDGTKVWLNAASTLTFTASFRGLKCRSVRLSGEAYFDVKRDQEQPFIVESTGQRVEVLGTHFNINSYPDEKNVKTTLLEGSVKVSSLTGVSLRNTEVILKPNQQSVLTSSNRLKVQEADIDLALAWKNNEFMFESGAIEDVMREVARWYDVEVIYTGERPTEKFVGSISRSHKISKVLQLLASTGGVHFKIEGQKIYVSK